MTKNEKKFLQRAVKILRKDLPEKERCKSYGFACGDCLAYRLLEDLDSYVNFYASTDEEIAKVAKQFAAYKVKKK